MENKRFRWGLLGPGRIAQQFANGLDVIEDAELYAVASSSAQRAEAFAKKNRAQKIYSSYESLVNDPLVDGVYIATPHRFHFENAMLCLQAGKPVLCEKPLTVNAAEALRLVETSRANNVFLMEALWTRYLPVFGPVRQWLDDGLIGEVKLMVSTFGFNVPRDKGERWLNPELAGGTLLDMGVYPIAMSQWVTGLAPQSVSTQSYLGETGVDELTVGVLKYANGVISQFSSNFICDNQNDFFIYGSQGHIRIHAPHWAATRASLVTKEEEVTVFRPLRGGGFEYETEEAMRCIREGLLESPGMPHAQSLANMELMDRMRMQVGLKYPFEK